MRKSNKSLGQPTDMNLERVIPQGFSSTNTVANAGTRVR